MIVCVYPGVYYKSYCANHEGYIYLDIHDFRDENREPKDWAMQYCIVAKHLSDQGYIVFISHIEIIRDTLNELGIDAILIYPSPDIKDKWIEMMRQRLSAKALDFEDKEDLDYVEAHFDKIDSLRYSGFPFYIIKTTCYVITDIIEKLKKLYY